MPLDFDPSPTLGAMILGGKWMVDLAGIHINGGQTIALALIGNAMAAVLVSSFHPASFHWGMDMPDPTRSIPVREPGKLEARILYCKAKATAFGECGAMKCEETKG